MLRIGSTSLTSHLLVGSGGFASAAQMRACHVAAEAQVVAVSLRGADAEGGTGVEDLDRDAVRVLPTTVGCWTPEDAVTTARLSREVLETDWVRLEVAGDPETGLPDNEGTLEAARALVQEGFVVLARCLDDPVVCRKLEDVGCAAVMPLAHPLEPRGERHLARIVARAGVPVVVDAAAWTGARAVARVAACVALGADGVLVHAALTEAADPVAMALAMRHAVTAGRHARLAAE